MGNETLLVRHGAYRMAVTDVGVTMELTEIGQEQAENARDELIMRDLGRQALVLTSTATRAIQTAEVIADGLETEWFESKRIEVAGNYPKVVRDLDEFISTTLDGLGIVLEDRNLIVVTHAPLIVRATGLERSKVVQGGVYEYTPRAFDASGYDARIASAKLGE